MPDDDAEPGTPTRRLIAEPGVDGERVGNVDTIGGVALGIEGGMVRLVSGSHQDNTA